MQHYSKIVVKITMSSTLFFVRNALPSHTEQYNRLLESLHRLSDVHLIVDDLCLKRDKETTVCYKWLSWKRPKLVPCFVKSHKLHKHKAWRLFSDYFCQKVLILCHLFVKVILKCNRCSFLRHNVWCYTLRQYGWIDIATCFLYCTRFIYLFIYLLTLSTITVVDWEWIKMFSLRWLAPRGADICSMNSQENRHVTWRCSW